MFPFRYQEDTYYIKRIIGLPGETVQIRDGEIYINGRLLEEEYGWGEMKSGGLASEPVILGRMNTLSWEITGTAAPTAESQRGKH